MVHLYKYYTILLAGKAKGSWGRRAPPTPTRSYTILTIYIKQLYYIYIYIHIYIRNVDFRNFIVLF